MSKIEQLVKDRAFYYISTSDNLEISDTGNVLIPTIGGQMAKAFWIKDSPASVWLFSDFYDSKDKFKDMLLRAYRAGATKDSVLHHARGAGGNDLVQEIEDVLAAASPSITERGKR